MKKGKQEKTLSEVYAERILNTLPPKQADLYRSQIEEYCRLFELEASVNARAETYQSLERVLSSSKSEVETIFGALQGTIKSRCESLEQYAGEPIRELSGFGLSFEAMTIALLAFHRIADIQNNGKEYGEPE